MIGWDPRFCELLVEQGFFVLRFDNRDIGMSSRLAGDVDLHALFAGTVTSVPYGLADMAADAAGLLDALRIDAAHLVGSSMGGMIAQTLAITYPERALSLCSIMSTTGDPCVGQPTAEALAALTTPPATSPSSAASRGVLVGRALSGGHFF